MGLPHILLSNRFFETGDQRRQNVVRGHAAIWCKRIQHTGHDHLHLDSDSQNRLIAARGYSYVYDGDGQRIGKCLIGATPGTCASNATGTLYWKQADGTTVAGSE